MNAPAPPPIRLKTVRTGGTSRWSREEIYDADRLLSLLDGIACGGKQVHDANVVATMLAHGIDTLVTSNLGDFSRFGRHVRLLGLTATAPA